MTRLEKQVNLWAVVLPFVATIAAIVLLWNSVVSATDLAILGVMYVLTGLGVTVGFHRLLTHRSFQVPKPVEYGFAVLGSMAVQGPVINWVADHRKHHAHSDEEGDPHSPHVGHGDGVTSVFRGLWHAHVGWLLEHQGQAGSRRYARDLTEDRGMRFINRRFPAIVLLSLVIPALAGWALTGGTLVGAATGLLWGGLVRIFIVHHVTWSVNSVCHFLGSRRFETDDESRNVFWLALPSFGESWHHNHHAFPRSARARPEALGARPVGAGDHGHGEGGYRTQRRAHLTRAPGGAPERRGPAAPGGAGSGAPGGLTAHPAGAQRGSRTRTRAPRLESANQISPPWASTIARQIVRPRPVPAPASAPLRRRRGRRARRRARGRPATGPRRCRPPRSRPVRRWTPPARSRCRRPGCGGSRSGSG